MESAGVRIFYFLSRDRGFLHHDGCPEFPMDADAVCEQTVRLSGQNLVLALSCALYGYLYVLQLYVLEAGPVSAVWRQSDADRTGFAYRDLRAGTADVPLCRPAHD